jgi:DHA2 family multidrug resistance protein
MKSDYGTETGSQTWRPRANSYVIALSVMLATFLEVLDITITTVSLPHIAGNLAATTDEATWVTTSYLISNAIILPASGWFALYFGRKRFFMLCITLFTFSSMLCGAAPSLGLLILARVFQGAGGGALQPLSQAILLESFPKEKRGLAMAIFGLGVVVAPVLGPTLGGWLTENYSWRWIFNINIPFGLLALFLISRNVEDPPYISNRKPGKIDTYGFAYLILWLGTLQIILDKGQQDDWFAAGWIRWSFVISMIAFGSFVMRQLRTPDPIVNLKVFLDRNFWSSTAFIGIFGAVMFSSITILPIFLQRLMGYTAELAGYATTPRGIGAMIAMPLVVRLIMRWDPRRMMVLGIVVFAFSMLMLSNLTLEAGMWNIVLPCFIQGFGIGFIMVPTMTMAMGTLPNEAIGNATGVYNLMRNLGGSVGISASVTYLARNAQANQALMSGNMTPYDPAFQHRLSAIRNGLAPLTGAAQAAPQAHGILYGILLQQANLQAYMNYFAWVTLAVIVCIPLALMARRVKGRGAAAGH